MTTIKFGTKVKSLVKDSGKVVNLMPNDVGVVVECNTDGTFDVYFPTIEGKLRTLKSTELQRIEPSPVAKTLKWKSRWIDDGSIVNAMRVYTSTGYLHEYEISLTRTEEDVSYCAFFDDQYKVGSASTKEAIFEMCQQDFQRVYESMGAY